jgi:hypothetical protein
MFAVRAPLQLKLHNSSLQTNLNPSIFSDSIQKSHSGNAIGKFPPPKNWGNIVLEVALGLGQWTIVMESEESKVDQVIEKYSGIWVPFQLTMRGARGEV